MLKTCFSSILNTKVPCHDAEVSAIEDLAYSFAITNTHHLVVRVDVSEIVAMLITVFLNAFSSIANLKISSLNPIISKISLDVLLTLQLFD
jgi:plasmid replication initiation protein